MTHHGFIRPSLISPARGRSRIAPALLAVIALAVLVPSTTRAGFLEGWESPYVSPGTSSTTLPTGWVRFSGGASNSQIFHPNTTAEFDQIGPLAGPAGGNQLLFLSGTNTGISRLTDIIIEADTIYELSAAIGNSKLNTSSQFWSLQLWADTNGSGSFEGTGFDTFIGQQFGTNSGAINPAPGEWALNTFTFNSATTPNLVGQRLIVFLNNFGDGTSYYDNVRLQVIPEPSSLALAALGGLGVLGLAVRRRARYQTRVKQATTLAHQEKVESVSLQRGTILAIAALGRF